MNAFLDNLHSPDFSGAITNLLFVPQTPLPMRTNEASRYRTLSASGTSVYAIRYAYFSPASGTEVHAYAYLIAEDEMTAIELLEDWFHGPDSNVDAYRIELVQPQCSKSWLS